MERIVGTGGDEYAPVIEGERLREVLDVEGAPEARLLATWTSVGSFFPALRCRARLRGRASRVEEIQPLLKVFDLLAQFRQVGEEGLRTQGRLMRHRGRAGDNLVGRNRTGHAGAGSDHHAIAYL